MPIFHETRDAVGVNLARCDSRSLVLERFADPTRKGDDRRAFFKLAIGKRSEPHKRDAWRDFLLTGLGLKPDVLLFAQLQARLMVNMAGGVMENAGLCLDRLTGIPYIPGSAVKGCARRMAIQQLLEVSDQTKKAALLVKIARVFGWSELEWILPKPQWDDQQWKEKRSDFAFACDTAWPAVRDAVRKQLIAELQAETFPDHYAGDIQFLPAYPFTAPSLDLELDVVTCHHREYYAGNPQYATAPDTEEPVPVVFPAVAPGHVFVFAVLPGRRCGDELLATAKQWLATGLSVFGLGAKTAAGYGWFDCSEEVQRAVMPLLQAIELQRRKDREEAEAKRKAEEAKQAAEKAEQERLAKAPPHEKFRAEYGKLADEPFAAQAKKYAEMTDDQRHGFVLALKDRRETAKRWAKKKPELLKPWQEHAQKLQPPIQLP